MNPQRGARFFALSGIVVLALMLYRFWFGESGFLAVREFSERLADQERRSTALEHRNRVLTGEVMALKSGFGAVEARARTELGMLRAGETFYLVVDAQESGAGNP